MTYNDCLTFLTTVEKANYTPDHQNSVNLMTYLDNIQNSLPVVHVTGTNGKGSTISFMKEIFISADYSVGTFMSPHILDYNELIEDNNQPINNDAFSAACAVIKEACDKMVADGLNHPTIFEILFGIAIVHFSNQNHDVVLIEVGLGGRTDATNVFDTPLMTIITPISYDHQNILGDTLEQIAYQKAGIIKKNATTILGPNSIEVINTISREVAKLDGHLYLLDEGLIHTNTFAQTKENKIFNLHTKFFDYKNLHTSMFGRHQEINMATAILAVTKLKKWLPVSEKAIRDGIKNTRWQCRNEILSIDPFILLDGGHNIAGLTALRDLIQKHYKDYKIVTILGILEDKSYNEMAEIVADFSDEIVLTTPDSSRAVDPNLIELNNSCLKHCIPNIEEAFTFGLKLLEETHTLLVVTGSLYLTYPAKYWYSENLNL